MPAEDDILLLQLIKQDDEKAFKHLFDTYFVSLCRFMSLYLRDKQVDRRTGPFHLYEFVGG